MALLFALLSAIALAATGGVPYPTPVALTALDGTVIQASVGAPVNATNGVVFIHMAGRNQGDWDAVAESFYRQNLLVLALDLRGHGANVPEGAAAPTLTSGDWATMTQDVRAAVAELRRRGAKKVALVGAEVGGNLALNIAADDSGIASVVMLSPGLDYKGIVTGEAAKRYNRPIYLVASREDSYSTRCATALDSVVRGTHTVQLFDAAGKGTRMFNQEPTLAGQLLGFVNTSWTAPAAPPATAVDIRVETQAIETSGGRIGDGPAPAPQ